MRETKNGATRSNISGKPQYEGYLSPIVIKAYGEYMLKHQTQEDGKLRASDNWQKGLTKEMYMDSGWRHFHDWWLQHRGYESKEELKESLCAVIFNSMGYLFELLKDEKD